MAVSGCQHGQHFSIIGKAKEAIPDVKDDIKSNARIEGRDKRMPQGTL
jgi:hypothetical protein